MKSWFKNIDNSPLIVFRIFLGFLLAAESFGAILTGWVGERYVETVFSFNHIGFDWLQIFHGKTMYVYFIIMGVLGIMVMLGYYYKISISVFTILWTGAYLIQKESYNNHYYLLLLVCLIMCFLPANQYFSVDVKRDPKLKSDVMPQWISRVMIIQITMVYLFSVVAKCYPGWLGGSFIKIMFSNNIDYPLIGTLTQNYYFQQFIIYSGLIFDLTIVPLLLWKRTRTIAFLLSILFHIFNSITLQIGIFPFFALSFILFFYPPETIRKLFFKHKTPVVTENYSNTKKVFYVFFVPYLIIQFMLPLRHYCIEQNVLWTEEGHRLSWRMMLRSREGTIAFKIIDKKTKEISYFDYSKVLTEKQVSWFNNKPDGIWQMVQYIKKEKTKEGKNISIYADSYVSINGSLYKQFVDPKVDLATVEWDFFKHSDWILPEKLVKML